MSNTLSAVFKKYQTIFLPILAVIVAVVIFALVVVPQALKIPETVQQIQKAESDLQALNTKVSVLRSIDSDKYKSDLETTLTALPQDPAIPDVFNQILLTLNTNGLTLDDVDIAQTPLENNTNMADFVMKISSTGTTTNLDSFITQVKKIPRVIKVQSFDAGIANSSPGGLAAQANRPNPSPDAEIQNAQSLTILITLQTFYQPIPPKQTLQTEQPVKLPSADDEALIQNIKSAVDAIPSLATTSAVSVPSGKADPFE